MFHVLLTKKRENMLEHHLEVKYTILKLIFFHLIIYPDIIPYQW